MLKNKKNLIILSVIAAAVVGGAFYVKAAHKNEPTKTEQQKLQDQEKQHQADIKKNNETSSTTGKPGDNTTGPTQNGTTASTSSSSLQKPNITRASQQSDGTVAVAAIVGSTSSGTCTAKFFQGSSSFTRTTNVMLVTNYYACGEFDVPKADFSSTGTWSVNVTVNSGGASATSDDKQVTVN
jgi:hypothetical protein